MISKQAPLRLMALSHSGPEGFSDVLDLTCSFDLACSAKILSARLRQYIQSITAVRLSAEGGVDRLFVAKG
jgi:hypothetical protein